MSTPHAGNNAEGLIEWLPSRLGIEVIGGKAKGLSDLLRWGFKVPPALVIRADAISRLDDPDGILSYGAIEQECAKLKAPLLAVRSSGVDEDGRESSFAGMHETVLGVDSNPALRVAIGRCIESARGDRAQLYRRRRLGDVAGQASLAVVVQRQIQADCAGVAFSADPLTGAAETLLIEAVPGLGESLVSGHARPTRVAVDRKSMTFVVEEGAASAGLSERQWRAIANCVLAVERQARCPVDVEWCIEREEVWLLQWRPITTRRQPRKVWTNTNAAELLPNVAKPLVFEVVQRAVAELFAPLLRSLGMTFAELEVLGLVQGRVYFNVNALLGWMRSLPGMSSKDLSAFVDGLGGDQKQLSEAIKLLRAEDLPTRRLSRGRVYWGLIRLTCALLCNLFANPEAALQRTQRRTAELAERDPRAMNEVELADHLHLVARDWFGAEAERVIFSIAAGAGALAALQALGGRWLGDRAGTIIQRLIQGMDRLDSAAAGLALVELAEFARQHHLLAAIEGVLAGDSEPLAEDALSSLGSASAATEFRRRFAEFLHRHGHHARGEVDISVPRWRDEPKYVLQQVIYAARAESRAKVSHVQRVQERAELVRETLAPLNPLKRAVVRALLARADVGIRGRENNKSEAIRRLALVRQSLLVVASRLQQMRRLESADDIWFLEFEEIDRALRGREVDRARLFERRHEHNRWAAQPAPPSVVVTGVRFVTSDDATATTLSERLTGVGASPGVVEGVARVVLHANSADGVLPGEILIAPHTDPGWTPYFLHALAVVTEFGGVLSHGAVVAREYGLPCVVNVPFATQRIRTGQRIRVNGETGEVFVLP